jgi:hypothetical protein
VFFIYLKTNSVLCHLQHKLIGFYNRDEKCLQRGTDWAFNCSSLHFVFKGLIIFIKPNSKEHFPNSVMLLHSIPQIIALMSSIYLRFSVIHNFKALNVLARRHIAFNSWALQMTALEWLPKV